MTELDAPGGLPLLRLAAAQRDATLARRPGWWTRSTGRRRGPGSIRSRCSSLCRHDDGSDALVACFWCLADVTAGVVRYGRGNPCRGNLAEYRFC